MTSYVLTLISTPDTPTLQASTIAKAHAVLAVELEPEWLSADEACDIFFKAESPREIRAIDTALRRLLADEPVDLFIQPQAERHKKLLIADMDSTIIQQECIDEIADFVGLREHISDITERAMKGELEFQAALRERVQLLEGLKEEILHEVIDKRISLTPGARTLVRTMGANGALCALISGGFTFFTGRVAEMAGFHVNQANELEIENGQLTGRVIEPILGQDAKLEALKTLRREKGLQLHETLAVGDGANDLAMIKAAGLGVAFHAKPIVAAEAHAQINHGDLTALLYLQGYNRDAFITS